jgi:hypothetical protein
MPTFPDGHPLVAKLIADARADGRIVAEREATPTAKVKTRRVKPALVAASHTHDSLTDSWTVPCEVPSLANSREWQMRNRVAQAHRKAVSRVLSRHLATLAAYAHWFQDGKTLRVTLTRLGGKRLDRTANLPASLKYVEDTCALFLGADDGAANWDCRCEQEPGGLVGVRITIERA